MNAPARQPLPHDLAAERALIGCCLLSRQTHAEIIHAVRPADFYRDAHAIVWEALTALDAQGATPDTLTLRAALEGAGKLQRVGGDEFLLDLGDSIPILDNSEHLAARVRELAAVRAVVEAAQQVQREAEQPIEDVTDFLARAERTIGDAAASRQLEREPVTLGDAARQSLERLTARQSGRLDDGAPLSSGLQSLDWRLRGGLWPGRLIIVAGRPGMGKSALAQQAAVAAGRRGPSLFFALEMPAEEMGDRAIAVDAQVDSTRMAESRLSRDHMDRITAAVERLNREGVWIDDTPGVTVAHIRRVARRMKRRRGLSAVFVDYLQLMRPVKRSDSREQDVAEISRSLKELAKELSVPVVALSQLNRKCEERADKRPQMSDLRESGAIEQDADVIVFVYRDEEYDENTKEPGIAELIVAKQRGGATGTVKTHFRKELTAFYDLEEWRQNHG